MDFFSCNKKICAYYSLGIFIAGPDFSKFCSTLIENLAEYDYSGRIGLEHQHHSKHELTEAYAKLSNKCDVNVGDEES